MPWPAVLTWKLWLFNDVNTMTMMFLTLFPHGGPLQPQELRRHLLPQQIHPHTHFDQPVSVIPIQQPLLRACSGHSAFRHSQGNPALSLCTPSHHPAPSPGDNGFRDLDASNDISDKKKIPLDGVCVCVEHLNRCTTSTTVFASFPFSEWYSLFRGGHSISLGLCPTKLPVKWDIQLGQLDVRAIFDFSVKWQPAKPRTGLGNCLDDFNFCTAFAI